MRLVDFATAFIQKDVRCKHCGSFFRPSSVHCYPHANGYEVEGYVDKQWVYLTCPKCGYQWALWKLIKLVKQLEV